MSVITYLGNSSQIWYWSLHVLVLGAPSAFYLCLCIVLDLASKLIWCTGPSAFGIYLLVFPYIFLEVDCFEWALINNIEKQRVHSVL